MGTPGSVGIERRFGALLPVEEDLTALTDRELAQRLPRSPADDDALRTYLGIIREIAARTVQMRPFDVQLLAAAAMLRGVSVEMATGEGKTLVGAVVAASWALSGRRVHVLAVNDYLAQRDATWMSPLFTACGVTVAAVTARTNHDDRRTAYGHDVVYVPVSEAGFDVLRDRLCTDRADRVLSTAEVAILDEADAVLIDEAAVPLVLATGDEPPPFPDVKKMTAVIAALRDGVHFETDSDRRTVHLTDAGFRRIERRFPGIDLFGADSELLTQAQVALHARALLVRDVDYVVREGEVHIVNQARGRLAALQRWPEGLQAAVEAKESVDPSDAAHVLDQILVADLVKGYEQVVGMSGTLLAVAPELLEFYGLEVGLIPPNRPCIRTDAPDLVHLTLAERDETAVGMIAQAHQSGRPVLVATQSVRESERFADTLTAAGLDSVLLNASRDADEAAVVAEAGRAGRITVSTQMAGRGTDIRLDTAAEKAGGLLVIGLGRFGSGRLDDQLRGRAGRQGDPGSSVFCTSLEDDLVRSYNSPVEPPPPQKRQAQVDAAQRFSEAARADLFRLTRRYNAELTAQRAAVLQARERTLGTDPGLARSVELFAIDRAWSGHLAFALELRDGIHLQQLGREDPLTVFNDRVAVAFSELESQIRAQVAADLAAGISAADLEARRPGATWTYMVTDHHFGSAWERAGARLFGAARG